MGKIRFLIAIIAASGILMAACGTDPDISPTATPQGSAQASQSIDGPTKVPATMSLAGIASPTSIPANIFSATATPATTVLETIIAGISLYVLVDDGEPRDPLFSSRRTEDELLVILDGMNDIWRQADTELRLETVATVQVLANVLEGFLAGDLGPFFNGFGRTFNVPGTAAINGYYVRGLGGANGVTVPSTRSFFVMDTPSVFDRRVSSHEVGHILGLEHTLSGKDRLLYPGTNGMALTSEEVEIARENASRLSKTGQ